MNAETREMVIVALLQALDAAHPQAMMFRHLMIPLKFACASITEQEVASLLVDLEEKGWLKPTDSEAAPELRRYKRTEEARAYLRRNGF